MLKKWIVREKKKINWEKILFIISGIIIQVVGVIAAWQAVSDMEDLKSTFTSIYDLMNTKSISILNFLLIFQKISEFIYF